MSKAKPKRRTGRPDNTWEPKPKGARGKDHPGDLALAEQLAGRGITISHICRAVGLAPRTYYAHPDKPAFMQLLQAIQRGRDKVIEVAASKVHELMTIDVVETHTTSDGPKGSTTTTTRHRNPYQLRAAEIMLRSVAGWRLQHIEAADEDDNKRGGGIRSPADEPADVSRGLTPDEAADVFNVMRRAAAPDKPAKATAAPG